MAFSLGVELFELTECLKHVFAYKIGSSGGEIVLK
jgi:hypothetical protein